MAKKTRKKQQFQARSNSVLRGVRVVSKSAPRQPEQQPTSSPIDAGARASDTALIKKLIEFFKEME